MSGETSGISVVRDYLLGDLPESRAEELERWYFGNSQGVDEVWAVFGEIVEEYLSGDLSEGESRRMKQKLRPAPVRRKMYKKKKSLNIYAKKSPSVTSKKIKTKKTPAGGWWKPPPPAVFFKPTQLIAAGAVALIALGVLI